ncbi:MAG: TIGR03790 family protein [Verrucomicrobia bacterium]|nr:TIGR03790 family protein [Verrucomicrobiota bacterium]
MSAWLGAQAAEPGQAVVVVYNHRMPESAVVAEHYARARGVPSIQVVGLDLPTTETMTRTEYQEALEQPLLEAFRKHGWFVFGPATNTATAPETPPVEKVVAAKVRYAVLCYGVPLAILNDPALKEAGMDKLRPELRRNEAAVDSELAMLPDSRRRYPLYGAVQNTFLGSTNASALDPTNGLLLVARLDGPSATIANALVDKALAAERDGLWGRAYFDLRGLTNGSYRIGDDWIRTAADLAQRYGYDTVIDEKPETFPASFPMSQIAVYAGWYDGSVSGPFTRPKVEFMPGAIAYHLHSFSAHSIRTADQYWVGPLLAKGATVTMGCVYEPYLEGTPDFGLFFARLLMHFTVGEAAYACQSVLSWQTTVVGDPLYRPFGHSSEALHESLLHRHSKLIEWSYERIVNLSLRMGQPAPEMIRYLEALPLTARSAVLQEKQADLYYSLGKLPAAIPVYQKVLALDPTPEQRIRVSLRLGALLELFDENEPAFALYRQFLKAAPDYPDLLSIYRKLLPLAQKLGKKSQAEEFEREIQRLSPPPPAPAASSSEHY